MYKDNNGDKYKVNRKLVFDSKAGQQAISYTELQLPTYIPTSCVVC